MAGRSILHVPLRAVFGYLGRRLFQQRLANWRRRRGDRGRVDYDHKSSVYRLISYSDREVCHERKRLRWQRKMAR